MPQINFALDSELNEKFRNAVFIKKGMKKGVISDALIEAVNLWIGKELETKKTNLQEKTREKIVLR